MYILRPNSQPDRLRSQPPALNRLTDKAGWPDSLLNWFADPLQNWEVSWRHGWELERCHTAWVYTCCSNSTAVLVLDKVKPWSPSPELGLSIWNNQQWHLCGNRRRMTEPTEYVLYSSNSSPASCQIKLSCLPSSLWSPLSMEQWALLILCTERQRFFARNDSLILHCASC